MEQQYRVTIEFSVVSKHDIDYMKEHMDVCMLKYGVSEIIPEGEKQEASLEGYEVLDFAIFEVEHEAFICEECGSESVECRMFEDDNDSHILIEKAICKECGHTEIIS